MTNQKLETALELALSVPSSVRAKSPSLETGYSSETQSWELIIRYSGDLVLPEDVTLVSLFGGYGILYLPENRIDEISALPQIEYIEKPKRLSFSLAGAKAAACIPPVTRPPKNLTGENVLIGIIDSGIDIYHPDFRNDDGTTRIVNLWDQTLGQVFSEEEINAALLADDGTFPSRDLSGHGTHVAGIAAGNGRASGGLYTGVATKSRLIVVKLGNLLPDAFPRTTELMTALDYCVRRSLELQMPLALNLSFGNNYGSHTGFSLLETYLDTIATIGRTTIAVGTGNEGNLGRHASDTLSQVSISRELSVGPGETSLNIQLWKDFSDEFQIRLTAPSGESVFLNENYIGTYQTHLDNTDLVLRRTVSLSDLSGNLCRNASFRRSADDCRGTLDLAVDSGQHSKWTFRSLAAFFLQHQSADALSRRGSGNLSHHSLHCLPSDHSRGLRQQCQSACFLFRAGIYRPFAYQTGSGRPRCQYHKYFRRRRVQCPLRYLDGNSVCNRKRRPSDAVRNHSGQ